MYLLTEYYASCKGTLSQAIVFCSFFNHYYKNNNNNNIYIYILLLLFFIFLDKTYVYFV